MSERSESNGGDGHIHPWAPTATQKYGVND
jgi:hypothetical protein